MKIKVGNIIVSAEIQPVMVILSEQDKINIANMLPHCTKYACFPDKWGTKEKMYQWMEEDSLT